MQNLFILFVSSIVFVSYQKLGLGISLSLWAAFSTGYFYFLRKTKHAESEMSVILEEMQASFLVFFAILALFVYQQWGLWGSLILLSLLGLVYGYFLKNRKHYEFEVLARLDRMSDREIDAALGTLDAELRDEILSIMQKHPEKYGVILSRWTDS